VLEGPRWHVAITDPGAEQWALQNLVRAGYEAYLPMIDELRGDVVLRTQRRIVSVPLWPGYVLVEFDAGTSEWRPIPYLEGVRALLGATPERPTPLPRGLVERLQATSDARVLRSLPEEAPIQAGAPLRIIDGPLAGFEAVCLWGDGDRVRVSAELFGAMVPVTVDRRVVSIGR
jgi:transcriptional antiterminator RfaH